MWKGGKGCSNHVSLLEKNNAFCTCEYSFIFIQTWLLVKGTFEFEQIYIIQRFTNNFKLLCLAIMFKNIGYN